MRPLVLFWRALRCAFSRGSCAYDDDLVTYLRSQQQASERKTEAIRRYRASSYVFGKALDDRREEV